MTVPAMDNGGRRVVREDDTRPRAGTEEGARFEAAIRKRQRARQGRTNDDDPLPQAAGEPPLPAWMTLAAGLGRTSEALQRAQRGGMADTAGAVAARDGLFPAGAEVGMASSGRALHLRFTQGQWAGVELQAALHAGQIVVTLRPLNRQQHRRLCDARSSLCEQVADETGHKVRLEIADATR